jgi:hypothetical protein
MKLRWVWWLNASQLWCPFFSAMTTPGLKDTNIRKNTLNMLFTQINVSQLQHYQGFNLRIGKPSRSWWTIDCLAWMDTHGLRVHMFQNTTTCGNHVFTNINTTWTHAMFSLHWATHAFFWVRQQKICLTTSICYNDNRSKHKCIFWLRTGCFVDISDIYMLK